MTTLETERLVIRQFTNDDAGFILELLNTDGWLRFIGDRGVRTLADAQAYIENGPAAMYARCGFSLSGVVLRSSGDLIGMCGLIQRDGFDAADLGFAFLPAYIGQGYAYEAATAVLDHGHHTLGMPRILAITDLNNARSIHVLEQLGFVFERIMPFGENSQVNVFVHTA